MTSVCRDKALDVYLNTLLQLSRFDGSTESGDRCLESLIALHNVEEPLLVNRDPIFPTHSAEQLFDMLEAKYMQQIANLEGDPQSLREQKGYIAYELDYALVVPDDLDPPIGVGETEWSAPQFNLRFERLLAALQLKANISKEQMIIRRDKPVDGSMRIAPYFLISIPAYDTAILVCNQVGQAVFVSKPPMALPMRKEQMLEAGALKIVVDPDNKWIDRVIESLGSFSNLAKGQSISLDRHNAAYYTEDTVYYDLMAFAAQLDEPSVFNLTTANRSMPSLKADCLSGETVSGNSYISNAAIALGLASGSCEVSSKRSSILAELRKIAGFVDRDRVYYEDGDRVRRDLSEFARLLDLESIDAINTSNINLVKITCTNGEIATGAHYLIYAAIELGIAADRMEASRKYAESLEALKVIAGVLAPKLEELDLKYFQNPTAVREDLVSVALSVGKSSITELVPYNFRSNTIVAMNNQTLTARLYLDTASVSFNHAENSSGTKNVRQETLNKLLEIAGAIGTIEFKRDKAYYNNKSFVLKDLANFANACGVGAVEDLTASSMSRVQITCCNNENRSGTAYLNSAARHLGLSSHRDDDNTKTRSKALFLLKAICDRKNISCLRDVNYYRDPKNVRTDLLSWASSAGVDSIEELKITHLYLNTVTCVNGEKVGGNRYLGDAATLLNSVRKPTEEKLTKKTALVALKELCGIEPIFCERDARYYRNPTWVRQDLISAAMSKGVDSIATLTLNQLKTVKMKCLNNETITGHRYLSGAATVMGLEGNNRLMEALEKLKALCGYQQNTIPRDKEYFESHETLVKDLSAFAKVLGLASYRDLRFTRFLRCSALTESGEEVTGNAYLYQWVRNTGRSLVDAKGNKVTGLVLFNELMAQVERGSD